MPEFISVVIPTFNRRETLRVILPALAMQTYSRDLYEIILVDNGSSDGTDEMIHALRLPNLRYIVQENSGRSGARNRGIREAQGTLVLFTDADIIPDRRLLESHARFYDSHRNSAVVGCEVQVNTLEEYEAVRDHRGLWRTLHPDRRTRLSWLYFLTGNALVEKATLVRVGMFDENFTGYGHEDLELGYRIEKSGTPILYNHKAVNYHWHPVSFDEQCSKMHLAGISTVRFHRKHRDFQIKLRLGMTPLSLGMHSLLAGDGWLMKACERSKGSSPLCKDIVLQHHYLNGIKEALSLEAAAGPFPRDGSRE
ncbi:MAG: glycosyltransferase family 2 protein [Candidatus Eremiobacteraeota bacterium]|nr:glycosyltransferase family 2 protein [Candidatus Eremiobacteraeota bacterium]